MRAPHEVEAVLSSVLGPVHGDLRDVRGWASMVCEITTTYVREEWYRRRVLLGRYMRLDVLSEAYSRTSVRELRQYVHFLSEMIRAESGLSNPSKVEDF